MAANSAICDIIGAEGKLTYRGVDIHELAQHSSFEETTYLLWFGHLPTDTALRQFARDLAARRGLPDGILGLMQRFPPKSRPIDVLRTAVSALPFFDAGARDESHDGTIDRAMRVTAQIATIVAAWEQIRHGLEPLPPTSDGSHAENLLRMLFRAEPDRLRVRIMDLALILHADHELNASTFAARVTAATLADIYAAVVAAIGALSGPLHGGANEQVMTMLQRIGDPGAAAAHVDALLAAHEKVFGFGHRVYRTEDPRVTHLREASRQLGQQRGDLTWYEISRGVEEVVMERKHLYPNVDFYSASAYFSMGIPVDLFTPVFAVSRISGWAAHVLEQYADNRLIRPRAAYIGERDIPYTPLQERVRAAG